MSYLLSLTQEKRDALFETIAYVDKPKIINGLMGTEFGHHSLVNYSQIYSNLRGNYPSLPDPHIFRTGDCVQNHDYRGCGKYYAIWLRIGLITHDADYIKTFSQRLIVEDKTNSNEESENDEDDEEEEESDDEQAEKRAKTSYIPTFITRDADGPHNDGKHHCYLSVHPDEYGYAPSAVFSSIPPVDYFPHLTEYTVSYFDPLLTHSKSYFGQIIQAAKESEQFIDNVDFPMQYFGTWDSEMGVGSELQWMSLQTYGLPENYFGRLRDLFNRHFDETAEAIHFDITNRRGGSK